MQPQTQSKNDLIEKIKSLVDIAKTKYEGEIPTLSVNYDILVSFNLLEQFSFNDLARYELMFNYLLTGLLIRDGHIEVSSIYKEDETHENNNLMDVYCETLTGLQNGESIR